MTAALVHLAWESAWLGSAVWGLCRLLPRLAPATRCTLWWAACVQILIVTLTALSPIPAVGNRFLPAWLGIWCVGLALRLIVLCRQHRRARDLVQEAVPLPPCDALEMLTQLGTRLGLNRMPDVCVSPRLQSPVLAGLWRPVLLLSVTAVEDKASDALPMAAAHELAHLRRRDLPLSLVPVLAQTLLWWNPLVHLAVREYALAREEACDAEAQYVTGTAPDEYGAMLLDYLALMPNSRRLGRSFRSPYRSLLRRLNAMRIPFEQPRQGPVGAFCSMCILVTAALSAYPLLQSDPPSARVAATPNRRVTVTRAASSREVQPLYGPRLTTLRVSARRAMAAPSHVLRVARAVARVKFHVASLPVEKVSPVSRIAFVSTARPRAIRPALPSPSPLAATAPLALRVADDVSPIPSPPGTFPDLSQMRSDLQSLKQQMDAQPMPQPHQISDCPPVLGKDFAARMQAEFGPQFRQRLSKRMREQLDRQMPILRAQVAQARREAEQAARDAAKQQRVSDLAMQEADLEAARAEAQAFEAQSDAEQEAARETARAQEQAFQAQGLADKARRDALKELQKEWPKIKDESRTDDSP